MKQPVIYIVANKKHGTLYTGVTAYLAPRVWQHKQGLVDGFTKKYKCIILVYYEFFADMLSAIAREKQIKAGSRDRKLKLIQSINPQWNDLYEFICK